MAIALRLRERAVGIQRDPTIDRSAGSHTFTTGCGC